MTQHPHEPGRSRPLDHRFLFRQADEKTIKPAHDNGSDGGGVSERLAERFPELLTGSTFLQRAMARVTDADAFGAMVIRPDASDSLARDAASALQVAVAESIDTVCSAQGGLWGQIAGALFGSIFPGALKTGYLDVAQSIQSQLAATGGSVTIGVASFPTLDFPKNRILDNARKALDHAAFFGPGSAVCFDAVSLNISGDQYYQAGDISGAIREFKYALRIDPANMNVRNSLGVCYGVLGDFEKSAAEFSTAARLDPTAAMAVYNLGMVARLGENDDEKALAYFIEADRLDGSVYETAMEIGKLYLETGAVEAAESYLKKAAGIRPERAVAHRYLGDCYAAMAETEKAVASYQKAVKNNPNDADALSALGVLMDEAGENPEITTAFCEHSVAIAPDNGLFRYRLAALYFKQDRLDRALAEFEHAHRLGHDAGPDIERTQQRIQDQTACGSARTG